VTSPPSPGARADLLAIFGRLEAMHAWRGWHWWPDADPFEVAVGAILVQNTAWTNVERALGQLRNANDLSPSAMARLSDDELEALVRPSGQFRQKAKKLRAFLALAADAGSLEALLGQPPPELRQCLLATWGIGEETADAIVIYSARRPAFVIDAYTRRIFGRLGVGPHSDASYREWQRFFVEALPEDRDLWARFHAVVVMHAKHLCLKRAPRCADCLLNTRCRGTAPGRDG